jgi:aspartyl-tRNA(Asn)/glutamyl-tRNA(Gln) amidotransferase subunit A
MTIGDCYGAVREWNQSLRALRMPETIDQASIDGSLSDLAISIKDVIDVRGWTVTCNHRGFADRQTNRDAPVVAALRQAGAHLIGASTTLEFAYGGFTTDGLYPPARNPWDLDRSPGGSSAGAAAAVCAGLCDAALATDTSGSVRGPAAMCGILGLKPGHGSILNTGIYPLADTLNVAGVLARRCDVLARVTSVAVGREISAAPSLPKRIGWIRAFDIDAGVEGPVAAAVRAALDDFRSLGVEVVEVKPPSGLQAYHAACVVSLLYEAWQAHGERLRKHRDEYDPRTWARLALGAFVSAEDYQAAMSLRAHLRREIDGLLDRAEILVTAGAPAPAGLPQLAPPFGMLRERFILAPFSSTGHPALTMPIGFHRGLPLSLQAVAGYEAEERLVGLAASHASRRPWQSLTPELKKPALVSRRLSQDRT